MERYDGISGTAISNLTGSANYPENPSSDAQLTSFEIPTNVADNYGARVSGYICAPQTGYYTFWIASDDNGELNLSTDEDPANKTTIATVANWTSSRQWDKYSSQKSTSILLVSGNSYYVEALMKEAGGGDNLAVGWAKPGEATTAHFHQIWLTDLSIKSMKHIFGTILSGFFSFEIPSLSAISDKFVSASVDIYQSVQKGLLPTPSKSHYTYNLRDLSQVFQGLLMVNSTLTMQEEDFINLWLHEVARVFSDRLVDVTDRSWLTNACKNLLMIYFNIEREVETFENLMFGDYLGPALVCASVPFGDLKLEFPANKCVRV